MSDLAQSPTAAAAAPGGRPIIVALVLCSAVSPLAINIFIPSIPSMAGEFGVSYAAMQLGLSIYLAMTAVLNLVAGPLSDYFGRRPVIIGGLVLFLVGTVMTLMAQSLEMFLLGRIVQAASAAGMVLSRAIVRDLFTRDKAASMIGYVTMGFAVAPMIGPAIGGILDDIYGWRASFLLLGSLGAVALLVVLTSLPETNMQRGRPISEQIADYRALVRTPAYWYYAAAGSFTASVFFSFIGGGPAIASIYLGMSATSYGLWFAACALGYLGGNFLAGRYSERAGIGPMMVMGSVALIIGAVTPVFLLGAGFAHPLALFGPTLLIGVGSGMVLPNATAGAVSLVPQATGAASGLMASMQIGFGALATVIAGIAAGDGTHFIAFGTTMALISLVSLAFILKAASHARTWKPLAE